MQKPHTIAFVLLFSPLWATSQILQDSATVAKQVDSLIQSTRALVGKRDFEKALDVNETAEKLSIEKFGRESAVYGYCCFSRGRILHFKGSYAEAEKHYSDALAIRIKALGRVHADVAQSLNNLANLYTERGAFDKAVPLHLEALAIREKVVGKMHIDYAWSLNNLAITYHKMGNLEKAEPLYVEAKDIREKVLGKESADYATTLNNLAILYQKQGKYEQAEQLILEGKAIREKKVGKNHPDYAASLTSLAILNQEMGNLEKVKAYYLEAKEIREKALGKEHPDYAASLDNLAIFYWKVGDYENAELYALEGKLIRQKVLGKDHPDYANSLNNLATIYQKMNNYEKAEPLLVEAKGIREKLLGKKHTDYALIVNNLGLVYWNTGNYKQAEAAFSEAKAIWEEIFGKEHTLYATSLRNLANVYWSSGQFEKAEPLYLQALTIWGTTLGKEHQDYTLAMNHLANLYLKMRKYDQAEPLYRDALAIRLKLLGKEDPHYSESLICLASIASIRGDLGRADSLFTEYSTILRQHISIALRHLSEWELNRYLKKFSESQDQILSFAHLYGSKRMAEICVDNALFYKGFLLNAANQTKRLIRADSTTVEAVNQLKTCQHRLAVQYALPIANRDSSQVSELEEKVNNIEKSLARSVAGYGETRRQVRWQEVHTRLKPGEAAIEFVRYSFSPDSTMYAALILVPSRSQPVIVSLTEENQLATLLAPKNKKRNSEQLAKMYTRGAKPLEKNAITGLYEQIWHPLDTLLRDVKTVYYSPTGLLHRINFDAMPVPKRGDKKSKTLGDQHKLVRLGSTRSLVVTDTTKTNLADDAVLFGGIQYEMDTTLCAPDSTTHGQLTVGSSELPFTFADRSLPQRGQNWSYLPGTAKEVENINDLLKKSGFSAQVFSGQSATEETFKFNGKEKFSPRILHLATHGFFFPDPKDTLQQQSFEGRQPVFKISDHPMIRSGLILAGGNHAWKTGKPAREDMEDGILTAYEISQMNLSNTELVVLSACETGLGDISGNEGVYGLQRAFKIAGAKYLIMSLWQVPDRETSEFMTAFYRNWLEKKQTIPDAFRVAQKDMRERFVNPYLWAGFVLVE